ncbi:sensor histidine kinase [Clostridium formicaceticum]|uniref:histidine kinase n=1 Tax=Clostridium formicaceticum TaxID=1497 RepID=A0AAC9RMJ7_9CLOT|nr:HAMP domain-containing sensor histidine kinase [Clostridium formicaceticum]AOY77752.1 two-component sensor histidine kinase [Clostridium formicaceticum]ARE88352.1 Alkaline phosphatase synthesis sensor protein PhoR [Clostridium formicaceticum]
MKFNSIVTKLWIILTLLILLVIGISSSIQTNFMENIYYQQQAKQLSSLGKKILELIYTEEDREVMEMKIDAISKMMDVNVMIVDKNNIIQSSHGLGQNIRDLLIDTDDSIHGPLTKSDVEKLLNGETVIHQGSNEYLKMDVLSAAIPLEDPNSTIRAVIIHAPLKPLAEEWAIFKIITIYTGVGGIIIATILSLIFSKKVSKPLLNMSKIALSMASGDFSRRVDSSSNDEVGLLATSLNNLSTQLQEKVAQLERLDSTRREFVSNLSHEMKTPLSIIQAFTEALQDNLAVDEDEKEQYLNNISEEVERLKRLVIEVLDLKKMEEGCDDFQKEYVDLKEIVESVRSEFYTFSEKKGIDLLFTIDKRIQPVFCNKDRIKQVFINLIDNALRHTLQGGQVYVTISAKVNSVQIEVRDTGEGIPSDDLPMIWERFYKVDKSRIRVAGGTGLGLAITKKIIETHGGCIEVQSKLSEGTTFTIVLSYKKNNVTKSLN